MKIHPSKKEALSALSEFQRGLAELQERTGVCEKCVDESSDIYAQVRFYDEAQSVCTLSE